MMRIAIAGGGGFAFILAGEIAQTANAVLVLSTREHPEFEPLGAQVAVVNYSDVEELRYTLQGVDLIISTVSGDAQLNLIDAARKARVRTFVPSEFEGALARRPTSNDPLGRGSEEALGLLYQWSQSSSPPHAMRYTVFSCGIFYERFAPGGLALLNISTGQNSQNSGDYLVNVANATAEVVELDASSLPVMVSMTSACDVARFVAAAIEIGPENWPGEFRMLGDNLSVRDIVETCRSVRNIPFETITHEYRSIPAHLEYSLHTGNWQRWYYLQRLLATADGRYMLGRANLNELIDASDDLEVIPERFVDWLRRVWGQSQPQLQPEFHSTTAMHLD